MTVTMRLPGILRPLAEGQRSLQFDSPSVGEAIGTLCTRFPGIAERVLDDDGRLRRFVNVYVNGDDIRFLEGEKTPLRDGDEIIIAPAVAGG